jgi:HAMP domain-containing protein
MTKHSFGWLEELDIDLARLARGAGALRLVFGQALEALARRGGHHELGFSSLEAYGLEQCERSARWIQQTRSMARRLEELPEIRQSVQSGRVSWSIAELLSRVATQADECAWLSAARGRTVRQMRELLRRLREAPKGANDDGPVSRMSAGKEDRGVGDRLTRDEGAAGQTVSVASVQVSAC